MLIKISRKKETYREGDCIFLTRIFPQYKVVIKNNYLSISMLFNYLII